ncbi:hypothetical protein KM043_002945 [Ampulex compressa]|nr:hypothetical protein KM043_002945 [Ampulex compressa]
MGRALGVLNQPEGKVPSLHYHRATAASPLAPALAGGPNFLTSCKLKFNSSAPTFAAGGLRRFSPELLRNGFKKGEASERLFCRPTASNASEGLTVGGARSFLAEFPGGKDGR